MVTLKEIAQHCGVSVTTVSNIVNNSPKKVRDETRKKVMEAIEELGYHPNYFAQGLRRQRTKTIGVITEDLAQFTTPEIVEGIMKYCEEKKYRVLLQNLRLYSRWQDKWYNDETLIHSVLDPAMKELVSIKADGLIYIAGHEREIHLFEEKTDMPLVLAYCCSDESMTSVEIDDEEGGYQMVSYILAQGYRKLGVISGRADNIHAKRRLLGCQRALFEAGILDTLTPGTFETLCAIHKYLFEDIYDFAGKIREVNIAKGNFRFAPLMYLCSALENIDKMPQSSFDEIIEKYVEMNIAHPFREGNGRATRIWLDLILKKEIGKVVDWSKVDKEDYLLAMERSPIRDIEIKYVLKNALTNKINDREVYMKGIDTSYYYEGYTTFKTEDLK